MSASTVPDTEPILTLREVHRLSVDQYHSMISAGVFDEDDQIELLDGVLVNKMPRNPRHDARIQAIMRLLLKSLPAGWDLRVQSAITLVDSEPEPDIAIVRGSWSNYEEQHPAPHQIGLVIEVADSTLQRDRQLKAMVYAEARLPVYWIVNLIDQVVEVYTKPNRAESRYDDVQTLTITDELAFVLDGQVIAQLPITEFLASSRVTE